MHQSSGGIGMMQRDFSFSDIHIDGTVNLNPESEALTVKKHQVPNELKQKRPV